MSIQKRIIILQTILIALFLFMLGLLHVSSEDIAIFLIILVYIPSYIILPIVGILSLLRISKPKSSLSSLNKIIKNASYFFIAIIATTSLLSFFSSGPFLDLEFYKNGLLSGIYNSLIQALSLEYTYIAYSLISISILISIIWVNKKMSKE